MAVSAAVAAVAVAAAVALVAAAGQALQFCLLLLLLPTCEHSLASVWLLVLTCCQHRVDMGIRFPSHDEWLLLGSSKQ